MKFAPDLGSTSGRTYPPVIPQDVIIGVAGLANVPLNRVPQFGDEFQLLLDYASYLGLDQSGFPKVGWVGHQF
jgi:hypothetical protein